LPLFQPKTKKRKLPKHAPEDAFKAIPHRAPQVEEKLDEDTGRAFLRYQVAAKGKVEDFFNRKFKLKRHRKFDLDEVGSYYWNLINGKRRLEEIESLMREEFGWDRETCRQGVLQYTMTLMEKQLIYLDLSHRAQPNGEQEDNADE
jgi:hypothetical protein